MDDDVRMGTEDIIETLRKKFERVAEVLDERGRGGGQRQKRKPWVRGATYCDQSHGSRADHGLP